MRTVGTVGTGGTSLSVSGYYEFPPVFPQQRQMGTALITSQPQSPIQHSAKHVEKCAPAARIAAPGLRGDEQNVGGASAIVLGRHVRSDTGGLSFRALPCFPSNQLPHEFRCLARPRGRVKPISLHPFHPEGEDDDVVGAENGTLGRRQSFRRGLLRSLHGGDLLRGHDRVLQVGAEPHVRRKPMTAWRPDNIKRKDW